MVSHAVFSPLSRVAAHVEFSATTGACSTKTHSYVSAISRRPHLPASCRVPAGTVEFAPDGSKFAVLGGGPGIAIFDGATEEQVRGGVGRKYWHLGTQD